METELNDLEFFEYLKEGKDKEITTEKKVTFGEDEIKEFFTDAELADQLAELKKLENIQKNLWKEHANSHVAVNGIQKRQRVIGSMPLLTSGSFLSSQSLKKHLNNSRTKELNTTARVNTMLPIMSSKKNYKKKL